MSHNLSTVDVPSAPTAEAVTAASVTGAIRSAATHTHRPTPDEWHCSLEVLCHSDTARRLGIDNTPDAGARTHLQRLSATLQDVARLLGAPLTITSGYRCVTLNAAVGGVENSQHITGQAADFKCPEAGTALTVAHRIAASDIPFDQLILEYGKWVHLSVPAESQTPRREILTILRAEDGYRAGLPTMMHSASRGDAS